MKDFMPWIKLLYMYKKYDEFRMWITGIQIIPIFDSLLKIFSIKVKQVSWIYLLIFSFWKTYRNPW